MRINIEAWYISESNTIGILYDGDSEWNVLHYQDNNLILTDTQINTTMPIPDNNGNYRIEIIGDTWIAVGNIQL